MVYFSVCYKAWQVFPSCNEISCSNMFGILERYFIKTINSFFTECFALATLYIRKDTLYNAKILLTFHMYRYNIQAVYVITILNVVCVSVCVHT